MRPTQVLGVQLVLVEELVTVFSHKLDCGDNVIHLFGILVSFEDDQAVNVKAYFFLGHCVGYVQSSKSRANNLVVVIGHHSFVEITIGVVLAFPSVQS